MDDEIELGEQPLLRGERVELHQLFGAQLLCVKAADGQTYCFRLEPGVAMTARQLIDQAADAEQIDRGKERLH